MTDEALVRRFQHGDEAAFDELVERHRARIYGLVCRLTGVGEAEDLAQDVFVAAYKSLRAFRGDAALSSWIYRITFNSAMSRLRSPSYQRAQDEQRTPASPDGEDALVASLHEIADWSQMADEHLLRSQLRRRLVRAVLALPAIYRAPVVLRDLQGMSTEEASAMLRVKDQTLKSRLHRGRLILRKQLADFAGGLTLHRPVYGA